MENCCQTNGQPRRSYLLGLLFGLAPHAFCLAFLIFSLIGAASAAAAMKKFLLLPYFFFLLIAVSLLFATLAAWLYLKKNNCLCRQGLKNHRRYLLILYSTIIAVNLLLVYVVFPLSANRLAKKPAAAAGQLAMAAAEVQIPCSGHAPLIIAEVEKLPGVQAVEFQLPNTFKISYNAAATSPEKIASLEIFKTFKLKFN
jgi:hypothetical protein